MIVIHTDASCKDGYCCWAYKSSHERHYRTGIVQTNNIAAVETLAAIKGIQAAPKNKKILIVSDSLITVKIIQQYGTAWSYTTNAKDYYRKIRTQLIELLHTRHVEGLWIASDNSNATHLEVDNLAKTMLQYYLKGVRL